MNHDAPKPEDPRNRLAGERTLLAWVRTGLAMMGFGFVVARFGIFLREMGAMGDMPKTPHTSFSLWIGTTLVLLGVSVCLLASREHLHFLRRLDRGLPYQAPRWSLSIIVGVILGGIGIAMAIYLVLLRT
jgi:putative membrane protein